jgi:hypothetical protein
MVEQVEQSQFQVHLLLTQEAAVAQRVTAHKVLAEQVEAEQVPTQVLLEMLAQ